MNTEPKPGTYGALTRSTEPFNWRRMLQAAMFSPEEFAEKGPAIIIEKGRTLLRMMEVDEKSVIITPKPSQKG